MTQSWNWRQVRELAAWLSLAVVVASELISVVRFGYLVSGVPADQPWYSAAQQSPTPVGVVWVLVLFALVMCCLLINPVVPRTRQIATSGALAVGIAAVLELFYLVCVLISDGPAWARVLDGVGRSIEILVSAGVAAALWRIRNEAPRLLAKSTSPSTPASSVTPGGGTAAGRGGTPPVWQADEAVGVQWSRARDAAAGAPADQVGGPDVGTAGWQPPPVGATPQDVPAPPRQNWTRGGRSGESPSPPPPA